MIISFFHECNPPRSTAQQRQFFKRGSALTPAAKKAKATWLAIVEQYKPAKPLRGAVKVSITVTWHRKRGLEPKTTRPDLDNVAKLLLDAMTRAEYWKDDSQVYDLRLTKFNGPLPGVAVVVLQEQEVE